MELDAESRQPDEFPLIRSRNAPDIDSSGDDD